jgi:hypothetical protein
MTSMRSLIFGSTAFALAVAAITSAFAADDEIGPYFTAGSRNASTKFPAVCPDGYQLSSVQTLKNAYDNWNPVRIWCRPIISSDNTPPGATEMGPFVSKEPLNNGGGAKVSCNSGYRVSRIQMEVDGDPSHQRSVRMWCKPYSNATPMSGPQPETVFITTEPESSGGSRIIDIPEGTYISRVVNYQETHKPYVRSLELWVRPFPKA